MRPFVSKFIKKQLSNLNTHCSIPDIIPRPLLIGTHDGSFHCDDALACGLLKHTKKFADAEIIRTRDEKILAVCDIVADVGTVYDPVTNRYDHHQKEFQDTMDTGIAKYNTRLSSAGLIYKYFGAEVIEKYAHALAEAKMIPQLPTKEEMKVIYDRMYKGFIEQVDGIDNGIDDQCIVGENIGDASLKKRYRTSTSLSLRVASLCPRWNENQSKDEINYAFVRAVCLTTGEFFDTLDYYILCWMPARGVVLKAFDTAAEVDSSKKILVLERGGCPWREHLLDIEQENDCVGRSLYVLYPDYNGTYRVQTVPKDLVGMNFGDRKSLPWKGLRDEKLSEASGVAGGIFVHVSGFIGGNKTFKGAVEMAKKAVAID